MDVVQRGAEADDEGGQGCSRGETSEFGMSEMLRMFEEDHRQREEEQAEERQRWLEEKRVWEVTIEEERQRRDEETRRRDDTLRDIWTYCSQ